MDGLQGHGLTKVYPNGVRALDGVSFACPAGATLTLLGPSGCGKTTLLRIIAGLEQPTSGICELDGRPLGPAGTNGRGVGFVFQNYALYPHLTVRGNLTLSLQVHGVPRGEQERRAQETAALLGIRELLDRRPRQLSGGQQQRVALGRALIRRPDLYLLDEPLSNLDAQLRESMRGELRSLFRRVGGTVIYVTHDQAEAMSLSDEVAVMSAGKILQCAPPLEIYARPASVFVATFVGSPRMTIWEGVREGNDLAVSLHRFPVPRAAPAGAELSIGIRPEDVQVSDTAGEEFRPAEVAAAELTGAQTLLTLRVNGGVLQALAPAREWPSRVYLRLPPERLHWFERRSGRRVPADAPPGGSG